MAAKKKKATTTKPKDVLPEIDPRSANQKAKTKKALDDAAKQIVPFGITDMVVLRQTYQLGIVKMEDAFKRIAAISLPTKRDYSLDAPPQLVAEDILKVLDAINDLHFIEAMWDQALSHFGIDTWDLKRTIEDWFKSQHTT